MSVKRARAYLFGTLMVVAIAVGATIGTGNEPVLGLDLQGGISVVYAPVGKFKPGALDEAKNIIDQRVNGLGVAEPDVQRQGDTISVDLPGVKDRDKALRIVGRTAELRFRPVLANLPPAGTKVTTTTTTAPGSTTTAAPGQSTTTSTTVPASSTTTSSTAPANKEAVDAAVASCDPTQVQTLLVSGTSIPTTSRAADKRKACVVLPVRASDDAPAERLYLGPTRLIGKDVDGGKSEFRQGEGYAVILTLKDSGQEKFNKLAGESFQQTPPTDQVAIVLDGIVQSNPAFREPSFPDKDVSITGNFTPDEADDLATIINYGALPVQLEKQTVNNVSPTLGQDQLDAGIAAGFVGLMLVALYMLVYYRVLGAVVIAGLLISAALTFALISYLGQSIGLTLTLAGVTGLIVSIGVTVDSYVVYFERLKDEVRTGKTVRSSVDRGFVRSFRTIIAADLVSLIGAAALYFLAIGSVRGFAFFLGVSTILDLLVSYFFMHPLVSLMARRPELVRMRGFGIAAGLDTEGATA